MIRAAGGKVAVTVRRESTGGDGIKAYLARNLGPWRWSVPAPKGHPQTPRWETLHGRAISMDEAVAAGLRRLAEVYKPNEGTNARNRLQHPEVLPMQDD